MLNIRTGTVWKIKVVFMYCKCPFILQTLPEIVYQMEMWKDLHIFMH